MSEYQCPVEPTVILKSAGACRVGTCMFWSATTGCIKYAGVVDQHDVDEDVLAEDKQLTVKFIRRERGLAVKRITAVLLLDELLTWLGRKEQSTWGWNTASKQPHVVEAVNNWCNGRLLYNVPELNWTPSKVAVTVHQPTLDKFNAFAGKNHNWNQILGLSEDDVLSLTMALNSVNKGT